MCSISEWGRYWVRIMTSRMAELTQLESVKSMIRYLPAKGTAGLARLSVNTPNREPSPPARMTARVFTDFLAHGGAQGPRAFVEGHVLSGRSGPGEIGPHAAALKFGPWSGLSVHRERAIESVSEGPRAELVEQESRSARVSGVGHGVGQAACAPCHGDGPVAHGDHLCQAARLVARGDQDHVGAGVDPGGKKTREPGPRRGPPRMIPLDHRVVVLEGALARAEQDELAAGREPAPHRRDGDIEALLRVQPRNDGKQWRARLSREAHLLLQGLLVRRAAAKRVGVEGGGERIVRRRVPDVQVEAVDDPGQPVLPRAQDAVQSLAERGRQGLARVGRAEGREQVRR